MRDKAIKHTENKYQNDKSPFFFFISNYLNCRSIDSPMKRPVLKEWIKTHDPTTCGLEETHSISIDTNTLKVKRWGGNPRKL